MLLYHATTVRKLHQYRANGYIRTPVRGFTTPAAAMAWAMRVGRNVILEFEAERPHKLPDHHNEFGEAWWNDGDVAVWKKLVTPQWSKKAYQEHMGAADGGGERWVTPCRDCTRRLVCRGATDQPFLGTCARYDPIDEHCALPDATLPYGALLDWDGEGNGICSWNIPFKYW